MSVRKGLDIALLVLFLIELGGMVAPGWLHETLGFVFVVLTLWHVAMNRGFFAGLSRGRYTARRTVSCASVLGIGVGVAVLTVSGAFLSSVLFPWARLADDVNWRSLHLGAAILSLAMLFCHILCHAGSHVRGRRLRLACVAALVLAAVGAVGLPYLDRWYRVVKVDTAASIHGERVQLTGRTLTAYFGRVGNTDFPPDVDAVSGASVMLGGDGLVGNSELLALMAQDAVGGDLFAIRTVKKYPASYAETTWEARRETEAGEPPELVGPLPDALRYDTLILVYPLWWGTLPRAAGGFLQSLDLAGKTLVPIVTHGSGGAGDSVEAVRRAAPDANIKEPLVVYSSDVPASRGRIAEHLEKVR